MTLPRAGSGPVHAQRQRPQRGALAAALIPPWASALILPVALIIAGAAGYAWATARAYDRGYAAAEAAQLASDASWARAVARLSAETARIGAATDARVATTRAARPAATERARQHVQAAPDFGAVRRPDSLHADRVRDLDAIAAAAGDRDMRD